MSAFKVAMRGTPLACRTLRPTTTPVRLQSLRYASSQGGGKKQGGGAGKFLGGMAAALLGAGAFVAFWPATQKEVAKPAQARIEYEKARPLPESKEDNRDLISSQHLQVKKSWEDPGVYAWGSNEGRVAAPDLTDSAIKTPRRIKYFDGQLLRDIKLDREFGAAITEKGDLVQWGTAFSKEDPQPRPTLKGKDLTKLAISRDRILALGKNVLHTARSKYPHWVGGEGIADIASGLEHALILTTKGRVFSAASSTSDYPSKGQLGIPGLTWTTRPQGPYDAPHEISTLKGFNITHVAAGDFHSLALEKAGRVFVFGDNTSGQLGFEAEREIPYVDGPIPLPFSKIYAGTAQVPRVTSIAAGGNNSFFTVEATKVASQSGQSDQSAALAPARDLGRVTADTWATGAGIYGSLGNGKWTHVTLGPTKIKPLSGLYEWDEHTKSIVPIRLARLSVGTTHAAAVMANETSVGATTTSSENDINWGADVLFWGGNEHYQLGTGKRNNVNTPMYIGPLDGGLGDELKGRKGEEHRLQITPRTTARLGPDGKGRKVSLEQRVECGRFVTAVYSGT
ncbi:mitochondrial protein-like protein Fmp25 [Apiospora aurea]|uniref:Mitochondrial protein-like protein Fmp25 n=1 Tax=Apiospora aurea TaxID=335848 RepID=A0ABR1PTU1_9PEZI